MIEAGLEAFDAASRQVNFDRIERTGRWRGAEMIVLATDLLAARQTVGAKQNSRQRIRPYRGGKIRRHVRRQRGQRRRRGKIQIAWQSDRRRAWINLVRERLVIPF